MLLLQAVFYGKGQIYIEPYTGFRFDLNNTHPHFKQINTGLQFSFKSKGTYELALRLQHSWPAAFTSSDSAFTPVASLPLYVNASKKILPSASSFTLMHRIAVMAKKISR